MPVEIVTRGDLENLRIQLLNDIKQLIEPKPQVSVKPWLKARDVRKLLDISQGKLQTLRVSGKRRSSKIAGVYYYKHEDIQQLMESGLA